jgi:DNA-binding response OmpR family regulator
MSCAQRGIAASCFAQRQLQSVFLRRARPDLVIVDWLLIDGHGLQVATLATQLNLPVVVTSGDHTKADEIEANGFLYLKKPFTLVTLMHVISYLLRGAQK